MLDILHFSFISCIIFLAYIECEGRIEDNLSNRKVLRFHDSTDIVWQVMYCNSANQLQCSKLRLDSTSVLLIMVNHMSAVKLTNRSRLLIKMSYREQISGYLHVIEFCNSSKNTVKRNFIYVRVWHVFFYLILINFKKY